MFLHVNGIYLISNKVISVIKIGTLVELILLIIMYIFIKTIS